MRTTKDLIRELASESAKFHAVHLIVGFEERCELVTIRDEAPLDKLNELVTSGGEPIGLIGIMVHSKQGSKVQASITSRPLAEYKDDETMLGVLEKLKREFAKNLAKSGVKIIHEP